MEVNELNYNDLNKISDFAFDYLRDFLIDEFGYKKDDVLFALLDMDDNPTMSKIFDRTCVLMVDALTYSRTEKPSIKETLKAYILALSKDLKSEIEN